MNTLTKLFLNAGLPTQFGCASYETKVRTMLACEAYWRAEMRQLVATRKAEEDAHYNRMADERMNTVLAGVFGDVPQ
jgi:hypothetical protein